MGDGPLDVLELASGTGEVTRVLLSLGHRVTGIDFSDAMLARARLKLANEPRARFVSGDAERLMEPDGAYDALVCRHLAWTLTHPEEALREWFRVLKPGGRLVVFDGDFVRLSLRGRLAASGVRTLERWTGSTPHAAPSLAAEHAAILGALPFRDGLRFPLLARLARAAGFEDARRGSYARIARAQRGIAGPADWLRTWIHDRFVLIARKP